MDAFFGDNVYKRENILGEGRKSLLIRVRLCFGGGIYILIGIAVTLVIAFGAGWRGFFALAVVVVLQTGVQAVRFDKAFTPAKSKGFVCQGLAEEVFPDRAGDMAAIGASVIQVNEALVAAHPASGQELGSITHEPKVGV